MELRWQRPQLEIPLPPAINIISYNIKTKFNVYSDGTHTHTLFFYTHTHFHTQRLLHTDTFTHRRFYTQMLLHTHTLSHTEAFTHRSFFTEAYAHRRFYTQKLLHTNAFTHRHFYPQTLLHKCRHFLSKVLQLLCWHSIDCVVCYSNTPAFRPCALHQGCDHTTIMFF